MLYFLGMSASDLREQMKNLLKKEAKPEEDGNVFAYTYTMSDEHFQIQQEAFDLFAGGFICCIMIPINKDIFWANIRLSCIKILEVTCSPIVRRQNKIILCQFRFQGNTLVLIVSNLNCL